MNGRNPDGKILTFPKVPRKKVGKPKYIEFTNEQIERSYRTNYDWKAYSPEQLPLMEEYWDEFVKLYYDIFPEKYQLNPCAFTGINLGTFNGSFQKAWMRLGFNMYGIEIADVIDELHEYGCQGHRGSFFRMPEIEDGAYDFAILDRCICGDSFYYELDKPFNNKLSNDKISHPGINLVKLPLKNNTNSLYFTDSLGNITDILGNSIQVPPYFSEIFRIIKPGGFLLATLYRHWSEHIMRELASYGRVSLWTVQGWHPLLTLLIETDQESTPLPSISELFETVNQEYKAAQDSSIETVRSILSKSPYVFNQVSVEENTVRFLFLPNNHLVAAEFDNKGCFQVKESAFWEDSPWMEEFFEPQLKIVQYKICDSEPYKKPLLVLADNPRYHPKFDHQGYNSTVSQGLSKNFNIFQIEDKIQGTNQVIANLKSIIKAVKNGIVLLSLVRYDCQINRRNNKTNLSLDKHLNNIKKIVTAFKHNQILVIFFDAIPFDYTRAALDSETQAAYCKQNQFIDEFNEANRKIMREMKCPIIDLKNSFTGNSNYWSKNGEWLSVEGAELLAHKFDNFLKLYTKNHQLYKSSITFG